MTRILSVSVLLAIIAIGLAGCGTSTASNGASSSAVAMGLKTTPIPQGELAAAEAHYKLLKSKWATPQAARASAIALPPPSPAAAPDSSGG